MTDIKLLLELSRSNSTLCPLQHNTVLRRRIKVAYGHYPTAYLYDLLRAAHRLLGPIWHVSNRSSSRDLRVYKIAASYLITVAQELNCPVHVRWVGRNAGTDVALRPTAPRTTRQCRLRNCACAGS